MPDNGVESSSSRSKGSQKRPKVNEELWTVSVSLREAIKTALADAADLLRNPKKVADEVVNELLKIPELCPGDAVDMVHEQLLLDDKITSIFLSAHVKSSYQPMLSENGYSGACTGLWQTPCLINLVFINVEFAFQTSLKTFYVCGLTETLCV